MSHTLTAREEREREREGTRGKGEYTQFYVSRVMGMKETHTAKKSLARKKCQARKKLCC